MATFKELSEFLLFQIAKAPLSILSRQACLSLGKTLGLAFYYLDRRHRLIALSNLKTAFGKEVSVSEIKRIARNSSMHFGKTFLDIINLPHLGEEKRNALINVEGEENLHKALREKKGALLFSAHYGSWEIAPFFLAKKGKLSVIARPLDNKLLERELLRLRTSQGSSVIYKHQATKKILLLDRPECSQATSCLC
jgi:KDO2-lipid IV(A) lauroyltransferase